VSGRQRQRQGGGDVRAGGGDVEATPSGRTWACTVVGEGCQRRSCAWTERGGWRRGVGDDHVHGQRGLWWGLVGWRGQADIEGRPWRGAGNSGARGWRGLAGLGIDVGRWSGEGRWRQWAVGHRGTLVGVRVERCNNTHRSGAGDWWRERER
jgi:hypothetical protein